MLDIRYLDKTRFITDTSQNSNRVHLYPDCTHNDLHYNCIHRPLHSASIQDINISVLLLSKTVSCFHYNHAGQGMVHITHVHNKTTDSN